MPVGVSIGCILLCVALSYLHHRFKCMAKFAVPGFVAPATHPEMYPVDETKEEMPAITESGKKKEEFEAVPFSNLAVAEVKVGLQ